MIAAMRVLSVGNLYPPHDLGGGYERVWAAANRYLDGRGHQVRVLCSDHRSDRVAGERDPDVHRDLRWYWRDHEFPPISIPRSFSLERSNQRVLAGHLGDFDPEIVVWWSMGGMSMSLVEAVRRRGIPALALVHDDWLDYGRRADAWHRRTARLPARLARALEPVLRVPVDSDLSAAARYLFVSSHTREHALASGLTLADTGVVHSGIDAVLLEESSAPERWGWRLLYVGRIDERKGVKTAVEAMAGLPAEASLMIVGDGSPTAVAEVRALADGLGLGARVDLVGSRPPREVVDFYDRCDVVVFPVIWEEPWGLVPLEAMARRRPVVATGRGGSSEYLRDGANCLLFEAGDARSLVDAVSSLGADSELRARLIRSGRETAVAHTAELFNEALLGEIEAHSSGERVSAAPRSNEPRPTRSAST